MRICAWAPGTTSTSRQGPPRAGGAGSRHRRRRRPASRRRAAWPARCTSARLHVAAHREHDAARHVLTPVVGEERVAVEPLQALPAPERIPRVGMAAEEGAAHRVEGDVVGLLAAVPDLPEEEVAHRPPRCRPAWWGGARRRRPARASAASCARARWRRSPSSRRRRRRRCCRPSGRRRPRSAPPSIFSVPRTSMSCSMLEMPALSGGLPARAHLHQERVGRPRALPGSRARPP